MPSIKYVYWQEGDARLDHLSGGQIPGARKVGELVLP